MELTGSAAWTASHPRKPGRALARLVASAGTCAAVIMGPAAPAVAGDPEAGRLVFADKDCARCHLPRGVPGGGPSLDDLRRPQGEMELAGRLWNHVPDMLAAVALEAARWPRISAREMGDLMAYLRADPGRDPQPDLYKGQVTLLRKDCLKCHSLRGEGGRVEPDLAQRRADYESAAAWAAAMWTHSPAMAAMAGRRGIPYPRFSGDEMGNLLGFLRHAATPAPARPTAPGPGR
jgi:mono/diheme cytochrome c family protein